jgi:transposase-like protein
MSPFFACVPQVHEIIYMTNAIKGMRMQLRKTVKTRGSLPSDEVVSSLLYLSLRNTEKKCRLLQESRRQIGLKSCFTSTLPTPCAEIFEP